MAPGSYEIHSEARGPHWIAWVSRDGSGKPERSVVLVAETREKAEARARDWAERGYQPRPRLKFQGSSFKAQAQRPGDEPGS